MKALLNILRQWNTTYSDFGKLQHTYILVALAGLVGAGIVGLINYRLGQSILFLATAAVLVFIANTVVWALLQTFVIARLSSLAKARKR